MNPNTPGTFVDSGASAAVARAQAEMARIRAAEDLQTADDALEIAKFIAMANAHTVQHKKTVVDAGTGVEQVMFGPDGKPMRQKGDVDPQQIYKYLTKVAEHNKKTSGNAPPPVLIGTSKHPNPQQPAIFNPPPQNTQHSTPPLLKQTQEPDNQMELNFGSQAAPIPPQATTPEVKTLAEKVEKIEGQMSNIEQMLKLLVQNNVNKA